MLIICVCINKCMYKKHTYVCISLTEFEQAYESG